MQIDFNAKLHHVPRDSAQLYTSICLPASDAFTSTCTVVCLKTCHLLNSEPILVVFFAWSSQHCSYFSCPSISSTWKLKDSKDATIALPTAQ